MLFSIWRLCISIHILYFENSKNFLFLKYSVNYSFSVRICYFQFGVCVYRFIVFSTTKILEREKKYSFNCIALTFPTVAEFFIIGERFVVITRQLQAAEVLSKLTTMYDKSSFVKFQLMINISSLSYT
jgi:uncharacterized protein YybS (DUF2232 family)